MIATQTGQKTEYNATTAKTEIKVKLALLNQRGGGNFESHQPPTTNKPLRWAEDSFLRKFPFWLSRPSGFLALYIDKWMKCSLNYEYSCCFNPLHESEVKDASMSIYLLLVVGFLVSENSKIDKTPPPPEFVARGAIELPSPNNFLIATGSGPEKIDLGTLHTNREYFVRIPITNMFGNDIVVKEVKSSCGCMTAANNTATIKNKESSSFFVLLSKQSDDKVQNKTITCVTSSGLIQFLITAKFRFFVEFSGWV